MIGIRLRQKTTQHETVYWFSDASDRDDFVKRFSKIDYEIVEFIGEQIEFPFDVR